MFSPSQHKTPLLDQLSQLSKLADAPFYAPGHKRGSGIPQPLANLLGNDVFKADLPELPELDNLFAPQGVIASSQALASEAFGADKTWFLVNGSTCGIIAAILATCGPGDKIILPRNIHQSGIAGLILSGAIPIFINPEYNPELDLLYSVTPEAVEAALKSHPDVKAVMIVYPTYHGVCGDIKAIATLTHRYHIPLLVDEAHGGHFAFHRDLPPSALSAGADLTIQSTHKVLGAMTQASMLHIKGDRISSDRVTKTLQLVQSTSPSYLLLASLDAARQQMSLQGEALLTQTLQLARQAREKIRQIPGLSVISPLEESGFKFLDLTRLTINLKQLGITGFEADEILHQSLGVTAELPMWQNLTFIISIGNTLEDIDKLVAGFKFLVNNRHQVSDYQALPHLYNAFCLSMSPREAFFAPSITVATPESIGCISAELVCPYPPGIPVLMPGEVITEEAIAYLENLFALDASITGCSDFSLKTLKVVKL